MDLSRQIVSTQVTEGIVIKKQNAHESLVRVVFYTEDFGKIDLWARGAQKMFSKLRGHIEPITRAKIMIVHGRGRNYLGGAIAQNCYVGIKNDLLKIGIAGEALRIFSKLIGFEQKDANLYHYFKSFLDFLDNSNVREISEKQFLIDIFTIHIFSFLGICPNWNLLSPESRIILKTEFNQLKNCILEQKNIFEINEFAKKLGRQY